MTSFEKYKWPIISIVTIIVVLMIMLAIGFTIGILSEDPDGLERTLIDARGEKWLEGLTSPWEPLLGGIENNYFSGIIGILLIFVVIVGAVTLIRFVKKKNKGKSS